jgi:translin
MQGLEEIAELIHQDLENLTAARDRTLTTARSLIRHCANAIRAIHREEQEQAKIQLAEALTLVETLQANLNDHPQLYYAGYTQDALKEFAEATFVYSFVNGLLIPSPSDLRLEPSTYLQGLAEAASELRRRCLDLMLRGKAQDAKQLLGYMDDIYAILVTMDYPDAITGGLRRLTDVIRGVIERTRGDLTLTLRQEHLEKSLRRVEKQLSNTD